MGLFITGGTPELPPEIRSHEVKIGLKFVTFCLVHDF